MNTQTLSISEALSFVAQLSTATTATITENTITVGEFTFEYKKVAGKIEILSSNTNVEPLFFFYNNTAQTAIQRLFTLNTTPTYKGGKKLEAYIYGEFGTLYVAFSVVKSTDLQPHAVNTLATLNFDIKECYVDISDEELQMPDRRPATDIPTTDTAEKITAILWANISEWELNGNAIDKKMISVASHYLSSYKDLQKLTAAFAESVQARTQKRTLTIGYNKRTIENIFKGNEADFNRYFAD